MPNRLSRFWQELKRRNVVRVVTVYTAVSLTILELVSNISEPFGLPVWTLKLVFVILVIGLILSIILSWIYDIHPDEGIIKTEPAQAGGEKDKSTASNGWKIASYISFVVIVGLIVMNVLQLPGRKGPDSDLETSIAVLPFENQSTGEEDAFLGNAFTEEIILALQKIKEFDRVLPFSSTMQFAEDRAGTKEIAEKLHVNYLIEGSIQKYQGKIRIRYNVTRALNEDHVCGDAYNRSYREPVDILNIQSEIAQAVAGALQVHIAPEEIDLIEKVPTTNLTALTLYQKGRDSFQKFRSRGTQEDLEHAKIFYQEALSFDPEFANAYAGLAHVYLWSSYKESFSEGNFLDSMLILSEKALSYNENLPEAYFVRGTYYYHSGNSEQAENEFDRAIALNPNNWEAYYEKASLFGFNDMVLRLENLIRAASLHTGSQLPEILSGIADACANAGFQEKAREYLYRALELDHDTIVYYMHLPARDNNERLEFLLKAYEMETNKSGIEAGQITSNIALVNMGLGDYKKALEYWEKFLETEYGKNYPIVWNSHRIGYTYLMNGDREMADQYFNQQIELSTNEINRGRMRSEELFSYYDLAAVYAFRGEIEKALEYLKIFNERKIIPYWVNTLIKTDPLLNPVRDEPGFQQIERDIETKYQAEHERVRQWLEEKNTL